MRISDWSSDVCSSDLWKVKGLGEAPLPLFAAADEREAKFSPEGLEPDVALRPMTEGREVVEDYRSIQLSLRGHPVAFVRDRLDALGIVRCADLATIRNGRNVEFAGVVLVRQGTEERRVGQGCVSTGRY